VSGEHLRTSVDRGSRYGMRNALLEFVGPLGSGAWLRRWYRDVRLAEACCRSLP